MWVSQDSVSLSFMKKDPSNSDTLSNMFQISIQYSNLDTYHHEYG